MPETYEVPPNEDALHHVNADDAKDMLAKLEADSLQPTHPLHPNSRSPQTKQFLKYKAGLFDIIFPENEEGLSDTEILMQQGMKEAEQRQSDRVTKGKELVSWLADNANYSRDEVPDDITEFQIRGLEEQKLHAQEKFDELGHMMFQDLQALHAPQDVTALMSAFAQAKNLDTELRSAISDKILRWIQEANKQKASSIRKPKPQENIIL